MNLKFLLMILLSALLTVPAMAEEEVNTKEVRYVGLTPALVTNYGGPGRMKYIKAEISLRVNSQDAFRAVKHHLPSLRHTLVMLLSRQTDDTVESSDAKEHLRGSALEELQAVMQAEEGAAMIEDVLFSTFFVQK
jgi:flagellar FliL protein